MNKTIYLAQGMLDPLIDPGIKKARRKKVKKEQKHIQQREQRKKIAFWEKKMEKSKRKKHFQVSQRWVQQRMTWAF